MEPTRVVGAALVAEADEQFALLLGVRRHHSALAGGQLLVRIEAERPRRPVRPDRRALVLGAERLTGIVDQPEPVPLGDRQQLLEPVERRPEREARGAKNLENCFLVALVEKRTRQRNAGLGLHASAGAALPIVAYSSHCAQRSLLPRHVSRYALCSSFVTGPGGPITRSSNSRIGVTWPAVRVMKISSAVTRS